MLNWTLCLMKTSKLIKMGTAMINQEVEIGAKELFKTNFSTSELISESYIQDKKLQIQKRTNDRGNICSFYTNDGVDCYLYGILSDGFTTMNQVHQTKPVSDNEIYKFGYITPNGQIRMLFGNHFVVNGREQMKSVFNTVKEYCAGKGEPFAYKK